MERIYRALLGLYPYDFRLWFGAEMSDAFARSSAGLRTGPRPRTRPRTREYPRYLRFVLGELGSLVAGSAAEWFAKWTGDRDARARSLPDWRMMRPVGISKEVWFGIARRRCSPDT